MNIYNLLHMAGLDEFLVGSLRAAMQLDGEDAPSDETLEIMATSAQEAVAKACFPVTAALKGAMENASKFHTARIKDLMAAGSRFNHLRPLTFGMLAARGRTAPSASLAGNDAQN